MRSRVRSSQALSTAVDRRRQPTNPVGSGSCRIRPVTVVDRSRSCPQECAQVGEIRARRVTRGDRHRADGASRRPRHAADLRFGPSGRPAADAAGGRRRAAVRTAWGRAGRGRGQGVDDGGAVHSGRVVHVSTQGDGDRPTAGQQGHSAPDLRKGARSPASTRVMTKMKYFSRGFSNHILGGDAPLGPEPREASSSQEQGSSRALTGTGFPPGARAGTMSTAPAPATSSPRRPDAPPRRRHEHGVGRRDEVPGGT